MTSGLWVSVFVWGVGVGCAVTLFALHCGAWLRRLGLKLARKLFDRFNREQHTRLQDEYKRGYDAGWCDGQKGIRADGVVPERHGEIKPSRHIDRWGQF